LSSGLRPGEDAGYSKMLIEKFEDGPIWTIGYLLYDPVSLEAIVIDVPMWSAEKIYRRAKELKLNVRFIAATHGHWDHVGDMKKLKALTDARVCGHLSDEWMMRDPNGLLIPPPMPVEAVAIDIPLEDSMALSFGSCLLKVIHTPGHSAGSICLYDETDGVMFTGDTLFAGSIGRTDLPSGSYDEIARSISNKIFSCPEETKIFPGHGMDSTLKKERAENPFVQEMFAEK
jgi:hydroxyacylglutathione hydrolase